MSIQEAIERGPLDRLRTVIGIYDRSNVNEALAQEAGTRYLQQAKVPQLLHELAEIIKIDSPDVQIVDPKLYHDYAVHMDLRWNFREEGLVDGAPKQVCDFVTVAAEYLSGALRIGGREKEILNQLKWTFESWVVEDAIIRAYREPGTLMLAPVMVV